MSLSGYVSLTGKTPPKNDIIYKYKYLVYEVYRLWFPWQLVTMTSRWRHVLALPGCSMFHVSQMDINVFNLCVQVSKLVKRLNEEYGEGTVWYEERSEQDITLAQRQARNITYYVISNIDGAFYVKQL